MPMKPTSLELMAALDVLREKKRVIAEQEAHLATVTAERDSLKVRVELLEAQARADANAAQYIAGERDALSAELAALKKRVADAVKSDTVSPWGDLSKGYAVGARTVEKPGRYALLRLEDGE